MKKKKESTSFNFEPWVYSQLRAQRSRRYTGIVPSVYQPNRGRKGVYLFKIAASYIDSLIYLSDEELYKTADGYDIMINMIEKCLYPTMFIKLFN